MYVDRDSRGLFSIHEITKEEAHLLAEAIFMANTEKINMNKMVNIELEKAWIALSGK